MTNVFRSIRVYKLGHQNRHKQFHYILVQGVYTYTIVSPIQILLTTNPCKWVLMQIFGRYNTIHVSLTTYWLMFWSCIYTDIINFSVKSKSFSMQTDI